MQSQEDKLKYFGERIINKAKHGNEMVTLTLTKVQLIDPMLLRCIQEKVFEKEFGGKKIKFKCADGDLFFKTDEFKALNENYQAINENGGELVFEETVKFSSYDNYSSNKELLDFADIFDKKERSFEEIVQINIKLSEIAEKINNGIVDENGNNNQLSPLEKYLICFQIVNDITYFNEDNASRITDGYSITRSLVDLVNNHYGCCVGKSEYLRALLSMVGIESCSVAVDSDRQKILYKQNRLDQDKIAFDKSRASLINGDYENDDKLYKKRSLELDIEEKMLKSKQDEIKESLDEYKKDFTYLNHQTNLIYLKDEKYGVDGIFLGDATWGGNFTAVTLNKDIEMFFNFGTLFISGDSISKFLDRVGGQSNQNKEDNEQDVYFNFSKRMIIEKFKTKLSRVYKSVSFETDKSKFLLRLEECKNYEQVLDLVDEKCDDMNYVTGEKNEYAKVYRDIFEEILYTDEKQFLNSVEIKNVIDKFKNAKLLQEIPQDKKEINNAVMEKFDKIFEGTEFQIIRKINSLDYMKFLQEYSEKDPDLMQEILSTKKYALALMSKDSRFFEVLSYEMQDDFEVVKTAVKSKGSMLEFASDRLKNDPEIVLRAFLNDATSIQYAPPQFQERDVFKKFDKDDYDLLVSLCEDISKFERMPLDYFKEENEDFVDFAMEIVYSKVEGNPENDIFITIMEETIKKNFEKLEIEARNKNLDDCIPEYYF